MRTRVAIILPALFVAVYVLPLGVRPLFQPDEVRYAELPREMLASGDWVVPRLDGLRYFEKPAAGYWLGALSQGLLGESRFAVRLPAALSAGLTALVVFLLVRRFGGGLLPAAVAAGALLTSVLFFTLGSLNILDMPLTLLLTAALAAFYCAWRAGSGRGQVVWLVLFGLGCGAAFLVKGFLAFVVPAIVIVPFLAWERRTGGLVRRAWVPAAAAVALVAPWAILIHLREPDFWRYFFWEEHIRRFLAEDAQHAEPFWYFLPVIVGGAMPWTPLVPAAALGLRREGLRDPFARFALCWLVVPFLFFSASHGKLATYVLPCLPPLAVLLGVGLPRALEGRRRAFAAGAWATAALLGALAAGIVVGHLAGVRGAPYGAGEGWKWGLAAGALGVGAALAALAARRRGASAVLAFGAAPVLLMLSAHFVTPRATEEDRAAGAFLARNAGRLCEGEPILAEAAMVSAACWFYKRDDVGLFDATGEFRYGLGYPDAKGRVVEKGELVRFLAQFRPETRVTLLMSLKRYRRDEDEMPKPEFMDEDGDFAFVQFRGLRGVVLGAEGGGPARP